MISPFSNASSPGSVGSKVCNARTRVTMFPFSAIAEPEVAAAAGVAVVVVITAETGDAAGAAEELAWLGVCDCGGGWVCGCW
jgi:hypothetical protein